MHILTVQAILYPTLLGELVSYKNYKGTLRRRLLLVLVREMLRGGGGSEEEIKVCYTMAKDVHGCLVHWLLSITLNMPRGGNILFPDRAGDTIHLASLELRTLHAFSGLHP